MALRGNLDSLRPTEVLQLLTQSGKSGTLVVFDERKTKLVAFDKGQVVHAAHTERLPPLEEVLFQRGLVTNEQLAEGNDAHRFDDEVVKIVDRRRAGTARRQTRAPGRRLGQVLVQQGRLRAEELDDALEPRNVPDALLHRILVQQGLLHLPDTAEARQSVAGTTSLYEGILRHELVGLADIKKAVLQLDEPTLIELLVHRGLVKKSVAQQLATRLEALRGHEPPPLRIGAYLVARGLLTQRQLERALGQQISTDSRLGDILVELALLTVDQLRAAETELALLRLDFSPLHPVARLLGERHGFTPEELVQLVAERSNGEETIAERLVQTGRIDENKVRAIVTEAVVLELADLLTWPDERYEFFEGFSLEDVLPNDPVARLHDFRFDFNSLLLDAHYRVDESLRTAAGDLHPHTILSPASLDLAGRADIPEADRRLLHRIDGRRPIVDVCSVLPGNLLEKRSVAQRLVDQGWVVRMGRQQAYKTGRAWLARGDDRQAVLHYEHGLATPGDEPSDRELRLAIQEARLARERLWLRRISLVVRQDIRSLKLVPPFRQLAEWYQRAQTAFDELLIRKGLARQWWTLKAKLALPLQSLARLGPPRVVISGALLLAVGVSFAIAGIAAPDDARENPAAANTDARRVAQPDELRRPLLSVATDAPLQVEPVVAGSAVVFAGRDGRLHSVPLPGKPGEQQSSWDVEVGEFGDVLSAPAVAGDLVFVANVRGDLHAIDRRGEPLWRTALGRLEPIQPLPLFEPNEGVAPSGASTVAVASRESLVLLTAATGVEQHRWRTGNRIAARPVVAGARLFFGSDDGHVYCVDWQERTVLWDRQLDDDVRWLLSHGDRVVVVLRGGNATACDASTGRVLWTRGVGGLEVHRLLSRADGTIGVELATGCRLAIDPVTGHTITTWTAPEQMPVDRSIDVGGLHVYATDDGFVGAFDERGNHLWRTVGELGPVNAWSTGPGVIAIATAGGSLQLVEAEVQR